MKLRHTLATAVGAFALVLSLPGSALAATGDFHYKYIDDHGHEQPFTLHNPHSGKCINLPAVGDDNKLAGYAPHNQTDTAVTVYLGASCTGPEWRLRADGNPAGDRLEVRSVRFDAPDVQNAR